MMLPESHNKIQDVNSCGAETSLDSVLNRGENMNCDNCQTEFTFGMALKQPTPFRFTCSKCKTKYDVKTPYMKTIFIGAIGLGVLFAIGLFAGMTSYDSGFILPYTLFFAVILLALEYWGHKYISARGQFTEIDS